MKGQELGITMKLTANLPDRLAETVLTLVPMTTMEREKQAPTKGVPMRRGDEVEAIAMEVAMRYERVRGWAPTDVSQDSEHYDVRFVGPSGKKRFIEVNGHDQTGAIFLTGPEIDKLRQLGERTWLYIVTFCKDDRPRLCTIQNAISKLNPEMLYRQLQYIVQQGDWNSFRTRSPGLLGESLPQFQ